VAFFLPTARRLSTVAASQAHKLPPPGPGRAAAITQHSAGCREEGDHLAQGFMQNTEISGEGRAISLLFTQTVILRYRHAVPNWQNNNNNKGPTTKQHFKHKTPCVQGNFFTTYFELDKGKCLSTLGETFNINGLARAW
jgi:hypothetical protein